MRVLVTGADGFVGRHLCRFFEDCGDVVFPVCGSRQGHAFAAAPVVDVRDTKAFCEVVAAARPDAIVHLAAASSVARSHSEPRETFEVNALGALNLCIAAKAVPGVRVLLVSSGEVYGPMASDEKADEEAPYAPMSPYSSAKAAAELTGFQFARSYGLHVVCARPFNHLGAGQSPMFVIPSLAHQVAEASRAGERATLHVGNLDPIRDFSHVRDVVAAYRLLLEQGASGEAYNVCSGVGRSIRSVLDEIADLAGIEVDIRLDPSKLRPAEIPRMVGNPAKIRALGWVPRWTVRDALREILAEAAARVAQPLVQGPAPSGRSTPQRLGIIPMSTGIQKTSEPPMQDEKRVEILLPSCNIETVKDGRGGIFTWVPKDPLMEFNMLYFQPGKSRGNHYHPEFNEYFLVVEGSGTMVWKVNELDADNVIHMSKGMCVRTPIGVAHAFYAITPVTAIAMLSKPWDECNPPIRHMQVLAPPKP